MRAWSPHLLTALLAIIAGTASAADGSGHNRYKWYDAAGNLHYGDALPPEAARLGYELVNPQGVVIKRVERARTAEELAAAKAAAARDQTTRDLADRRSRADEQLVTAYPTEADLRRAQHQQLDMLDQQINAARISLRNQEQSLADLLARAADVERSDKALPDVDANQLATLRKQVDDQHLAVARTQASRDQATVRFETEVTRYRELQALRMQRAQ